MDIFAFILGACIIGLPYIFVREMAPILNIAILLYSAALLIVGGNMPNQIGLVQTAMFGTVCAGMLVVLGKIGYRLGRGSTEEIEEPA